MTDKILSEAEVKFWEGIGCDPLAESHELLRAERNEARSERDAAIVELVAFKADEQGRFDRTLDVLNGAFDDTVLEAATKVVRQLDDLRSGVEYKRLETDRDLWKSFAQDLRKERTDLQFRVDTLESAIRHIPCAAARPGEMTFECGEKTCDPCKFRQALWRETGIE